MTGEKPTRKISTRKTCGMGDAKHHSLIHEDRRTGFGRAGNPRMAKSLKALWSRATWDKRTPIRLDIHGFGVVKGA